MIERVFQRPNDNQCFSACVASILRRPLQTVPDFYAGLPNGETIPPEVASARQAWFIGQGFYLATLAFATPTFRELGAWMQAENPGLYYILNGVVQGGRFHSVICRGDRVVHDPAGCPMNTPQPYDGGYTINLITFLSPPS